MGCLITQTYQWHIDYPHEKRFLKTIVWLLFVLEVVSSILLAYDIWLMFGRGYGDMDTLDVIHTEWLSVCVIGAIVAGIVQFIYAFRLWMFSRSRVAFIVVLVLALIQTATGIGQGIKSRIAGRFSVLQKESPVALGIWIGSAALCDVIIAVLMVYHLRKCGRDLQSERVHAVLSKIIVYTLESGMVTAAAASSIIILFFAKRGPYFDILGIGLAKLYTNTLMVILNSRRRVRADFDATSKFSGLGTLGPSTPTPRLSAVRFSTPTETIDENSFVTNNSHHIKIQKQVLQTSASHELSDIPIVQRFP
ncbi:hypothetical protein DL96DRAFT_213548 [Flagelloscypha sp. PMI_526]|nr:hypothetical protein DL96DRAFT_213548 [Flagelloscypha sp. PMI_526]